MEKKSKLGFETGLFNRLTMSFTYFNKRTTDEIVSQSVAPSSGFPGSKLVNLGEVQNKGIELEGTLKALDRRSVSWDIGGTLGTAKDLIKANIPTIVASGGQANLVGYPIGGIFQRRVVSADRDPATKFATNVLCDGGEGKPAIACAQAPFVFIGTPTPKDDGLGEYHGFHRPSAHALRARRLQERQPRVQLCGASCAARGRSVAGSARQTTTPRSTRRSISPKSRRLRPRFR